MLNRLVTYASIDDVPRVIVRVERGLATGMVATSWLGRWCSIG